MLPQPRLGHRGTHGPEAPSDDVWRRHGPQNHLSVWGPRCCWPCLAVAPVPNEAASSDVPSEPDSSSSPTEEEPEGELAEVVVRATSASDRLRQSAEAVQVVDTRASRRSTADLGETLARTAGITVQRAGGLGSDSRFSLNGLEGDQIRFFVDGVPLDFAGFSFGFANVPVNLVQRVEVYRGVVPARFGADAVGGAVNLVSFEFIFAPVHEGWTLDIRNASAAKIADIPPDAVCCESVTLHDELLVPRSTAEADVYDVEDVQTTVYRLSGMTGAATRLFTMPGYLGNAIRLR